MLPSNKIYKFLIYIYNNLLLETTCINEERLKIYIAYENILNMDKAGHV